VKPAGCKNPTQLAFRRDDASFQNQCRLVALIGVPVQGDVMRVSPTVVVLRSQGHWLSGALVNNLTSVAGPSARADVNQMLIQPFVNYNLRHGWYLTSSPIITANWKMNSNERWTVPVGGGVGRIVHFGKQPVNIYAQFFRNVERPDGITPWSKRMASGLARLRQIRSSACGQSMAAGLACPTHGPASRLPACGSRRLLPWLRPRSHGSAKGSHSP
jgi:hypothetical protein